MVDSSCFCIFPSYLKSSIHHFHFPDILAKYVFIGYCHIFIINFFAGIYILDFFTYALFFYFVFLGKIMFNIYHKISNCKD